MSTIVKKKASFGTSMGISSIIAILVILLLVVFSILTLTTANADLQLSQKSSDSIKAFYVADAVAEDILADISVLVSEGDGWQTVLTQDGYVLSFEAGGTCISYTVSIDEYRNLSVELFVDPDGNVTRTLWQTVPAKEWVADENVNLYIP